MWRKIQQILQQNIQFLYTGLLQIGTFSFSPNRPYPKNRDFHRNAITCESEMSGHACPKFVHVRVRVRGLRTCPCPKSCPFISDASPYFKQTSVFFQWLAKDWRILTVLKTWKMCQFLACQFLTVFYEKLVGHFSECFIILFHF